MTISKRHKVQVSKVKDALDFDLQKDLQKAMKIIESLTKNGWKQKMERVPKTAGKRKKLRTYLVISEEK